MALLAPLLMRLDLSHLQVVLEPRGRRRAGPAGAAEVDGPAVRALARRVDTLLLRGWPVVRRGCTTRGVTLYYALRRLGFDATLCFGIEATGADRAGHCWVAVDGAPFLERVDPGTRFLEVARVGRFGVVRP